MPNHQPLDDVLEKTVDVLVRKQEAIREEAEQQIARLQKMIDIARQEVTPSAQVPAAPKASKKYLGPPGEYSGMELGQALLKYMNEHAEKGPIPVSRIRNELLAAGVNLGKKRKRQTLQSSQEGTLFITAYNYHDVMGYDTKARTIWMKKGH